MEGEGFFFSWLAVCVRVTFRWSCLGIYLIDWLIDEDPQRGISLRKLCRPLAPSVNPVGGFPTSLKIVGKYRLDKTRWVNIERAEREHDGAERKHKGAWEEQMYETIVRARAKRRWMKQHKITGCLMCGGSIHPSIHPFIYIYMLSRNDFGLFLSCRLVRMNICRPQEEGPWGWLEGRGWLDEALR